MGRGSPVSSDLPSENVPVKWLGDARSMPWPDESVDCIVTSPPYWGQRDYGHPDQIGLEPTYIDYLGNLDKVAAEMWRVLVPGGVLWLNLGDTYNTRTVIRPSSHQAGLGHDTQSTRLSFAAARDLGLVRYSARQPGLKDKDLMGLPWRVALNLIASGWHLRADVVWAKPFCAPENAPDRPRRMHEYVFMLTKGERCRYGRAAEVVPGSVWSIAPTPSGTDHTASFPDELVRRCITPCTAPGDVVADPFGGSGTTARVAASMGRIGWSLDLRDWTAVTSASPTTREDHPSCTS